MAIFRQFCLQASSAFLMILLLRSINLTNAQKSGNLGDRALTRWFLSEDSVPARNKTFIWWFLSEAPAPAKTRSIEDGVNGAPNPSFGPLTSGHGPEYHDPKSHAKEHAPVESIGAPTPAVMAIHHQYHRHHRSYHAHVQDTKIMYSPASAPAGGPAAAPAGAPALSPAKFAGPPSPAKHAKAPKSGHGSAAPSPGGPISGEGGVLGGSIGHVNKGLARRTSSIALLLVGLTCFIQILL